MVCKNAGFEFIYADREGESYGFPLSFRDKKGETWSGSFKALWLDFHICLVIYNASAILKFNSYDFLLCFTCSGEINTAGWCFKSEFLELGPY